MSSTTKAGQTTSPAAVARVLGTIAIAIGLIFAIAGAATWLTVRSNLAGENITLSDDAAAFAGNPVDGPIDAWLEANVINKHALEASGGKTYAELDREDPVRVVVMNGSFLRASLFTSVIAFGVAGLAIGTGVVLTMLGAGLRVLAGRPEVLKA